MGFCHRQPSQAREQWGLHHIKTQLPNITQLHCSPGTTCGGSAGTWYEIFNMHCTCTTNSNWSRRINLFLYRGGACYLNKLYIRNKTAHTFGLCLRLMPSRAKNKTLSAWMVSPCLTFILFLVEPMAATISSTSAPMMPTQIQPTASPATTLSIFHASSLALPCTHASNFAQIKL